MAYTDKRFVSTEETSMLARRQRRRALQRTALGPPKPGHHWQYHEPTGTWSQEPGLAQVGRPKRPKTVEELRKMLREIKPCRLDANGETDAWMTHDEEWMVIKVTHPGGVVFFEIGHPKKTAQYQPMTELDEVLYYHTGINKARACVRLQPVENIERWIGDRVLDPTGIKGSIYSYFEPGEMEKYIKMDD